VERIRLERSRLLQRAALQGCTDAPQRRRNGLWDVRLVELAVQPCPCCSDACSAWWLVSWKDSLLRAVLPKLKNES
jgi:hypothetical protein